MYNGNDIKSDACDTQFDYHNYKSRKVDIYQNCNITIFKIEPDNIVRITILDLDTRMNIHYCSCLTLEECKDITLGDCHIREEYIIQSIQAPTAAICQEACFLFADCKNFNFNGSTCLLLKEDYRQECDTTAAPFVRYNNEFLITYGIVSGYN